MEIEVNRYCVKIGENQVKSLVVDNQPGYTCFSDLSIPNVLSANLNMVGKSKDRGILIAEDMIENHKNIDIGDSIFDDASNVARLCTEPDS